MISHVWTGAYCKGRGSPGIFLDVWAVLSLKVLLAAHDRIHDSSPMKTCWVICQPRGRRRFCELAESSSSDAISHHLLCLWLLCVSLIPRLGSLAVTHASVSPWKEVFSSGPQRFTWARPLVYTILPWMKARGQRQATKPRKTHSQRWMGLCVLPWKMLCVYHKGEGNGRHYPGTQPVMCHGNQHVAAIWSHTTRDGPQYTWVSFRRVWRRHGCASLPSVTCW